jgi:hypothetical protein
VHRDRAGPTVVELVGLAGAGKSTLARELVSGTPTVQVGLPLSRAASARAQAVATAPFVLPYLVHSAGTPWFSREESRALGYLRAWRRALAHPADGPRYVVFDHGPLFRLALLDAFGPPLTRTAVFRRWWCATLDFWARELDLVVWLDAPDDLLVHRIQTREQRHVVRSAADAEAHRFLTRYRTSYSRVLDHVRLRSPDGVLALCTDVEPSPVLAERVRERLRRGARLDV